jgi:general secretion pathway protein D
MRSMSTRMVYSPERNSLADTAPTGSVLPEKTLGIGVCSGRRHTLQGVKDANGRSMGRGQKTITKLSASQLRAFFLFSCFAGFGTSAAYAQSATKWDKRGAAAEARQDYDTALEDYHQALLKKPGDIAFTAHYEHMRFLASVAHIDRGRVLRQSGDLNGAFVEFTRASQIDPGNQTAQQELQSLENQQSQTPPGGPAPPSEQIARQNETLKSLNSMAGPIELKPVSNDPITIHSVEDVKAIYQAIGKLAGLNVIFDPDYTSKRVPVDLTNVSLSDALRIVGTLSGTFFKPVTSNTIFVAQNTRTKRTDLDEQAIQTFYLTNVSQQNDANEVVVGIRNLLDPSVKIYLVPSQSAIVMRATPDQLMLAQKLINDLDRARPEVVVDVAILQVNRDKVRNLGITLPQSFTLTPQANPNAPAPTSSSSSTGTTVTSSNFTLNSLAHISAQNFGVGLTGGTLNALLTDNDTHILDNPRIRATDGQRATLKIGQKIPVATGSYNAGVSTGVASIGVQTQFTYLDVGVAIDLTPTVHYDHEVTLKLKMEVSSEGPIQMISGVAEPIIEQNVSEQTIQLQEGEPAILAGLITRQNNLSITGTPGLGELPFFFKYFFSSQSREVQSNEIVFILIPHIVRESVLTRMNTRAIDTGTGSAIELRHDADLEKQLNDSMTPARPKPIGHETTAANAAAAMVNQLSQQTQPITRPIVPPQPGQPTQTQTPAPAVAVPAGPPISLTVVPPAANQAVGSTFQVAVNLANGRDVFSVPMQLQFNPAVLQLVNVDSGDFLGRDGQAVVLAHRDEGNGLIAISAERPPNAAGVSGQGGLCTLTFKAIAPGDSNLALVKVGARNSAQANLPAAGSQAVVHVK